MKTQKTGYVAPHYLYTFTFANKEVSVMSPSQRRAIMEITDLFGDERWFTISKGLERFTI